MTTYTGDDGVVKIGANTVAEVLAFSITEESGVIDDTAKGETAESHQLGRTRWSGQVRCMLYPGDTNGQAAMTLQAQVTLNVYVTGDGAGLEELTGTATITNINRESPEGESIAVATYDFQGTGALTHGTV